MPRMIGREEVLDLTDRGAPLIDVLPPHEHEEVHIEGSVGIWLRELDGEAVAGFDRVEPIIVYCHDNL